jgi:antitoxin HigA-1
MSERGPSTDHRSGYINGSTSSGRGIKGASRRNPAGRLRSCSLPSVMAITSKKQYQGPGSNRVKRRQIVPTQNLAHPGEVLREYTGDRSIASLADELWVDSEFLSRSLNGQAPVSDEMAQRLFTLFGMPQQFWRDMQAEWDVIVSSKG